MAMVGRMTPWTTGLKPFAEALFATCEGPAPSQRIDWLCADFEDFVELAGPRSKVILGGALALATLAPIAIGRRPPLARLDLDARCRALEALEESAAGLPLLALKAILCTIYFEHPDVRREIVDREVAS